MKNTQREKHERLCRYVSRPPIAVERLALTSSGQVRYTPKAPYRDGTTHIVLEPLDLMARLAARAAGPGARLCVGPQPRGHLARPLLGRCRHGGSISLSFTFVGLTRRVDRNLAVYLVSLLSYRALGIWTAPGLFAAVGLEPVFLAFAALTASALGTLPSVLSYNLAQGIAWSTLLLVGTGAGLEEQSVANALGVGGGAVCIALLHSPLTLAVYVVAVCGFNLLWNFVLPFILGAVGDMDTKGGMMSPAIAMPMVGLGVGPNLTGCLIEGGSYQIAEWVCLGGFAGCLVLIALPIAAQRRLGAGPAAIREATR